MGRTTATCMFAGRSVPARVMLDPLSGRVAENGGQTRRAQDQGREMEAARRINRDCLGVGLVWGGSDAKV